MEPLVVYYSRTGTTAKAAVEIAGRLGCDTERILDKRSWSGPIGYMAAGREVMRDALSELEPSRMEPSQYDLVIIGTPVWVYRTSIPVRTYLVKHKEVLGRVAFFATYGSSGFERTMDEMAALCGKAPVATLGLTTVEVRKDRAAEKYDRFVAELGK
jgi:menaquinone-dependent protoporphyrinogen IX oxidase